MVTYSGKLSNPVNKARNGGAKFPAVSRFSKSFGYENLDFRFDKFRIVNGDVLLDFSDNRYHFKLRQN